MLLKLSDQISECLGYAVASREQANAAADPSRKADFLNMERRWLRLVESYRFVEQAARFLEDSHLARMPSSEKLPQTGVLVVTCPTTGKDFSTGIMTDAASLTLTPKELIRSHCPHCDVEHAWWTKDAKLVAALPPSKWVENARAEVAKANFDQKVMLQAAVKNAFWSAPTTQTLIERLLGRIDSDRALIVVTHRPEMKPIWADHLHATPLRCRQLGREHCVALVRHFASRWGMDDALLHEIAGRSDGVPLYVKELTKAVLAQQSPDSNAVPLTLRDSLMARLDSVTCSRAH